MNKALRALIIAVLFAAACVQSEYITTYFDKAGRPWEGQNDQSGQQSDSDDTNYSEPPQDQPEESDRPNPRDFSQGPRNLQIFSFDFDSFGENQADQNGTDPAPPSFNVTDTETNDTHMPPPRD